MALPTAHVFNSRIISHITDRERNARGHFAFFEGLTHDPDADVQTCSTRPTLFRSKNQPTTTTYRERRSQATEVRQGGKQNGAI